MNAQIDPYIEWLQIPTDRRPPTYYDLLGLPAFQADAARAHAAASERIAHVRRYQMGAHSETAILVMGEISRALTCLADPVAKRQYDAFLRGEATLADDAAYMDTRLEEPTEQRIEPLPAELAGSSANASLAKLTALVDLVEGPPQNELQNAGVAPAVASPPPESSYPDKVAERLRSQWAALDRNTQILLIAAIAVASTLLLLVTGRTLSGSKDSRQIADRSEPSRPLEAPGPAPAIPEPLELPQPVPSEPAEALESQSAPPLPSPAVTAAPLPMTVALEAPAPPASPAPAAFTTPAVPPDTTAPVKPVVQEPEGADTFETAYDELDSAVDKASKDKKGAPSRWQPVMAKLAALEQSAQSEPQRDAVKRMRRRLAGIADDRLKDAIRVNGKDFAAYVKHLNEAMLLDPTGDAGKKAQQMLGRAGMSRF